MMPSLAELTLAQLTAGVVVVALTVYALLGGADFGGGVWDLLASGPRRDRQRALISEAMGPIWEANHVWLIVVVVLLFVCFPPGFSTLGTILHIPLSLMLIGIVLRGSAFVFRAYSYNPRTAQRRWGRVFSVSSIVTPVVLGMAIGAIAEGDVGEAMAAVGYGRAASLPAGAPAPASASFAALYVWPWLSPFTVAVGLMTLALFAFLAAVYLTVEAEREPELADDFRRRALGAGIVVFVAAFAALSLAELSGGLMTRLIGAGWAMPLQLATDLAALGAMVALARRRYRLARLAAGAQVSLILWGWAFAQFPYLIPPRLTIDAAAAPPATLRATLAVLGGGAVVLVPSLWYLLTVFKARENRAKQAADAPAVIPSVSEK